MAAAHAEGPGGPDRRSAILSAALRYADRGLRVLPVLANQKQPVWQGWPEKATCDPTEIESAFRDTDHGVGIATGAGLIVIDLDAGADIAPLIEELGELPEGPVVSTGGGGTHHYFRAPEDVRIGNSAGKLAPRIDVRGDRGFVVAPPTMHSSGKAYRWVIDLEDAEIPDLPSAWMNRLVAFSSQASQSATRTIPRGARNDRLFRHGCAVRGDGGSLEEVLRAVRVRNNACDPPLDEEELRQIAQSCMRYDPGRDYVRSDGGNANRLVDLFVDRIRYSAELGWFVYDGTRWRNDFDGLRVTDLARISARLLREDALHSGDTDAIKFAVSSDNASRIRNAVELAKSDPRVQVTVDDLDREPDYLNLVNGVLDLRTSVLLPHDPQRLMTKQAGAPYESQAEAPRFGRFLQEILPSAEERQYLQRLVGYCLTGHVSEQVFAVLLGSGANGKSVLCELLLRGVLGDYAQSAPFELFVGRSVMSDGYNGTADFRGARLVLASEAPEGARWNESLLKSLTGGDTISARFHRQHFFQFRPTCKFMFRLNDPPFVRNGGDAFWRRLHVLGLHLVIPAEKRDPTLIDKLLQESAGVLRWAVDGARAWYRDGLGPPESVRAAVEEYREDQESVIPWIEARCETGAQYSESCKRLLEDYRGWCAAEGLEPVLAQAWGRKLKSLGYQKGKLSRGVRARRGLRLRS